MRILHTLALAGTCTMGIATTWVKTPSGYPYNWSSYLPFDSAASATSSNVSGSTVTVTCSYSYTWYDQVTGSTNTAPPWTSSYSSLYNNNVVPKNQSHNVSLPTGYSCKVWDKLYVDEGAETWAYNGSNYQTRNKVKYIMDVEHYVDLWETGGGGGGG